MPVGHIRVDPLYADGLLNRPALSGSADGNRVTPWPVKESAR